MDLETIIGLEIHVQLDTKTKMFSRDDNDAWGAGPNTRVNPVSMGFPGMLPVINKSAVEKGVRGAAALGCKIQRFSKFDRKNYFYPDLPSGYQISQYDQPISQDGMVEIIHNGEKKRIGITRLHLENDAGKLTHTSSGTLCDYNRAGTPLAEIVTEPDLRSPEEAQSLAKEIQRIMRFVEASKADMEKGMMRFDASISLRPRGETKLYPRTEIKNLNSFVSLLKALKYEQKMQKKMWEEGNVPNIDRTVGWLDDEEKTQVLREKESAMDYRYFPEPDLPPITFTDKEIAEFESQVPELPLAKYERYQSDWGISEENALKLTEEKILSDMLEGSVEEGADPKKASNIILSVVIAEDHWRESNLTPEHIADVVKLTEKGEVSSTGGKAIIVKAMESGGSAKKLMNELGLKQSSNTDELEKWVDEVLAENPKAIEDYKAGNDKSIQFLMGMVMKKSQGKANPGMVLGMLKEKMA